MPNRIIKESICTSDTLDLLSAEEERLFYRIIVNCDDYGRMEASLKILRSKCFPLKIDKVKDADIAKWLANLSTLLTVYQVEDRTYLQLKTWEKHQQIRAKHSKYPSPDSNGNQLIAMDSICPRNPIQSNPIHIASASKGKQGLKIKFGKFQNVFLFTEEYEKLKSQFGETVTMEKIETLSEYIASKGKHYKSHYATILSWSRKDAPKSTGPKYEVVN